MIEVSCCIIAKNEEAHIKGCLQSVFQEVDEIIFVDTGSTDKTVEIASQFTPKLKLFYYEWHDVSTTNGMMTLHQPETSL